MSSDKEWENRQWLFPDDVWEKDAHAIIKADEKQKIFTSAVIAVLRDNMFQHRKAFARIFGAALVVLTLLLLSSAPENVADNLGFWGIGASAIGKVPEIALLVLAVLNLRCVISYNLMTSLHSVIDIWYETHYSKEQNRILAMQHGYAFVLSRILPSHSFRKIYATNGTKIWSAMLMILIISFGVSLLVAFLSIQVLLLHEAMRNPSLPWLISMAILSGAIIANSFAFFLLVAEQIPARYKNYAAVGDVSEHMESEVENGGERWTREAFFARLKEANREEKGEPSIEDFLYGSIGVGVTVAVCVWCWGLGVLLSWDPGLGGPVWLVISLSVGGAVGAACRVMVNLVRITKFASSANQSD